MEVETSGRRIPRGRASETVRGRAVSPLIDLGAIVGIALVVYLAFRPQFLGYDLYYALDWGDDLASGRNPEYGAPFAPTPHPLSIATGLIVSPLGFDAEPVIHALVLAGLGALCVGVYRLGAELYAWPVGLLAAVIVVTREPILFFATRPSIDVPFAAMVVWAAVLEARRPRSGAPVLALLSAAGLLRPEGWAFAGAYWLWVVWPLPWSRRLVLGALAASAPVIWMVSDLLVTGDPLWSFHSADDAGSGGFGVPGGPAGGTITAEGVVLAVHNAGSVAEEFARFLGGIVRLPELVLAAAGSVAGLLWLRRRTLLPAAVAALNGGTFVALSFGHVVVANRFLFSGVAMLSVLAAVAILGWRILERDDPLHSRWRVAGLTGLVVLLAFSPAQAGRLADLREEIDDEDSLRAELRDLVRMPGAEAAISRRCGPIYVPNHSFVPQIAYWMNARPSEVVSLRSRPLAARGVLITAASPELEQHAFSAPTEPARLAAPAPPKDYRPIARTRTWRLYTGCRSR